MCQNAKSRGAQKRFATAREIAAGDARRKDETFRRDFEYCDKTLSHENSSKFGVRASSPATNHEGSHRQGIKRAGALQEIKGRRGGRKKKTKNPTKTRKTIQKNPKIYYKKK
jgi:hypothetical protein